MTVRTARGQDHELRLSSTVKDVGRFNKNLQIPARWGITKRLEGVPSVLVVEPDGGTLVNAGHVSALSDARHMTPQSLAEYLARWTN